MTIFSKGQRRYTTNIFMQIIVCFKTTQERKNAIHQFHVYITKPFKLHLSIHLSIHPSIHLLVCLSGWLAVKLQCIFIIFQGKKNLSIVFDYKWYYTCMSLQMLMAKWNTGMFPAASVCQQWLKTDRCWHAHLTDRWTGLLLQAVTQSCMFMMKEPSKWLTR